MGTRGDEELCLGAEKITEVVFFLFVLGWIGIVLEGGGTVGTLVVYCNGMKERGVH